MHEMALSEGVMQIVEANARSQGFRRVKAVWLEIGELHLRRGQPRHAGRRRGA